MTSIDISGIAFPVAGMLSRWVQCDQFRKCYRELKGKDCPDVPIVIETYMMKSRGTKHSIDLARKAGKPVTIHELIP